MPRIRRRVEDHRHLLTGSAVLVVGAGVQALFGALFWLIAARTDDNADVGDATALFTSVLFVVYVASLGLPVALARFAPGRDEDSAAFTGWSVLTTAAAGAIGGVAYLELVHTDATDALRSWSAVGGPLLFAALCIGAGWSLLLDVRWMTVRRWNLVLVRMSAFGLARLPLLALPIDTHRPVFLFTVAMGPPAISGLIGVLTLRRVTGSAARLRPAPSRAREAARFSLVNWLATLAYQGPQFALPVIVLANVASEENASFYVAWGVVAIALYVPLGIGQALLAEGGKDGAQVRSQVRLAVVLATGIMVAGALLTAIGSDLVTVVYGDEYRDGANILPALVAATIPWAITSVYLTEARVRQRNAATILITGTLTIATLVPALVLVPDDGLDGAALAFVVGNVAAAIVAVGAHLTMRRETAQAPAPPIELADVVVESVEGIR